MTLTIGQVAARAGVNIQTVRYYERRGLLPDPERSKAGYRLYELDVVRRLRFIKRAQELGFTLEEIQELLNLRVQGPGSCASAERAALAKLELVARKQAELDRLRERLEALVDACRHNEDTAECPILDVLDERTV